MILSDDNAQWIMDKLRKQAAASQGIMRRSPELLVEFNGQTVDLHLELWVDGEGWGIGDPEVRCVGLYLMPDTHRRRWVSYGDFIGVAKVKPLHTPEAFAAVLGATDVLIRALRGES